MSGLDRAVGLAALAILLAGAALPGNAVQAAAQAPGFAAYHYRSDLEGNGFREVFLVTVTTDGFAADKGDVRLLVNGKPVDATWAPREGRVAVGDGFSFAEPDRSDLKQVLTAEVGGHQVMRCLFGIGAALGVSPDEWRAIGQPEQIRCLQLLDDQLE